MKKKTDKLKFLFVILGLLAVLVIIALVFMHFGGFGTGKSADVDALADYAQPIKSISVPENAKIIALGDASYGNQEFQELKLTVFRQMVENNNVRAFALEADFGGCAFANDFIHGGEGTAQEAAAVIGNAMYRTEEMAELLSYMRQYNETASDGDDLRFYGFDIQQTGKSAQYLLTECTALGLDTTVLSACADLDGTKDKSKWLEQIDSISALKKELKQKNASEAAMHHVDMLLQYCAMQAIGTSIAPDLTDSFMTENLLWIIQQEQKEGREYIFVSGHNSHVAKNGSKDSMGMLLSQNQGEAYYVIGTDFYKACCNLSAGASGKRTNQVFYSHDPLAKAVYKAEYDLCWLDFSVLPVGSVLEKQTATDCDMGNVSENYSVFSRLLPSSYRTHQMPSQMYDSMIFVSEATPTEIKSE